MNRRRIKKHFFGLKGFFKTVSKEKVTLPLYFLVILFFLLPGQNYYQTLTIQAEKPFLRESNINLLALPDYPKNLKKFSLLSLTGRSVMVIDVPSAVILYQKNSRTRLLPASITKMVTALVALENYSLEQIIEVNGFDNIQGQAMGLFEGEKITVEALLYGLLVQSGNDAAEVLASAFSGGREKFIEKMNEKIKSLNLEGTHFVNPTGFEEENHYTTAFDLAQIAAEALKNPVFAKMVAIKEIDVSDSDGVNWHHLENINELLDELWGIKGVKTGWTEKAGECLVAYFERNGRKVITVVLGSNDRFGETKKLINWVFDNFAWQKITPQPIDY